MLHRVAFIDSKEPVRFVLASLAPQQVVGMRLIVSSYLIHRIHPTTIAIRHTRPAIDPTITPTIDVGSSFLCVSFNSMILLSSITLSGYLTSIMIILESPWNSDPGMVNGMLVFSGGLLKVGHLYTISYLSSSNFWYRVTEYEAESREGTSKRLHLQLWFTTSTELPHPNPPPESHSTVRSFKSNFLVFIMTLSGYTTVAFTILESLWKVLVLKWYRMILVFTVCASICTDFRLSIAGKVWSNNSHDHGNWCPISGRSRTRLERRPKCPIPIQIHPSVKSVFQRWCRLRAATNGCVWYSFRCDRYCYDWLIVTLQDL